jgi:hypothetical protein
MDRENIALTVGGVIATMALAYMFYRMQQRDAAQAIAAQDAADVAAQDSSPAADPYNNQLTEEWLAANLTSANGAALTGLSSNTAASVATSSAVSDSGLSYDSTDTSQLLSNIVAAYSGAPSSLNVGSTINPGSLDTSQLLSVPAIAGVTQSATGNIPLTAADAIAQAELALSPSTSSAIYGPVDTTPAPAYVPLNLSTFLASMESSAGVSSHPVTAHPIVSIGS